jgi:hypothetical protein
LLGHNSLSSNRLSTNGLTSNRLSSNGFAGGGCGIGLLLGAHDTKHGTAGVAQLGMTAPRAEHLDDGVARLLPSSAPGREG